MTERKQYIRPRQWIYVEGKKPLWMKLGCCNCGILHRIEFKKTKEGVAFRMWNIKR
jgi:uncharacterized protein YchJ